MKRLLIYCFIIFLSYNALAENNQNQWRTGPFHFQYLGEDSLSEQTKDLLYRSINNAFTKSSSSGSIQFPLSLKIIITGNSAQFSSMTRMPRDAAACYSRMKNALILQHPHLLERRGILERSIYHESLHWMIFEKRGTKDVHDNLFMDEFLTEALSPSSEKIRADRSFFPDDYEKFLTKIKSGFSSKRTIRQKARDAAGLWGAFIINNKGMDSLMNYVVFRKPDFDVEGLYKAFLEKFGK